MTIADHLPAGLTFVTVDSISIAVEVVHNGTPTGQAIAWLHGLGSSATHAFANTARHPALTGVTSLLIDLPGHGLSGSAEEWSYTAEGHAAVVNPVLVSMGIETVTLLGHSMGGAIAITCAVSDPEGLERLIVAEPSLDPGMGNLSAHIAAQSEELFVNRGYPTLLRITDRLAAQGDPAAQSYLPSLRLASPIALHLSATSLCEERTPSFREQLAGLTMPAALITGDRSPSFEPPLDATDLMGYVVPDAGHVPMADNPDGFAQAVAAALGRTDDGTRNS